MKWLDDRIKYIVGLSFDPYHLAVQTHEERLIKIEQKLAEREVNIEKVKSDILRELDMFKVLEKDILDLKEDLDMLYKRILTKLDERDKITRADFETSLVVLTKRVDVKLDTLGDKRGTVTELLKRIAKLEGDLEDKIDTSHFLGASAGK